jgi:hypothetical protein
VVSYIKVGRGGWCLYKADEFPLPVYVRFGLRGERIEAREFYLAAENGIDGGMLRAIPMGQVEALANWSAAAEILKECIRSEAGAPVRDLGNFWREVVPDDSRELQFANWMLPRREWQDVPPGRLDIPPAGKKPDGFYRDVAEKYGALAASCRDPATRMAEANKVPRSTVHRWVKEARRRGLMQPGRKAPRRGD